MNRRCNEIPKDFIHLVGRLRVTTVIIMTSMLRFAGLQLHLAGRPAASDSEVGRLQSQGREKTANAKPINFAFVKMRIFVSLWSHSGPFLFQVVAVVNLERPPRKLPGSRGVWRQLDLLFREIIAA